MSPHLTHVALFVHDVSATVDFYRDFVGLHLVHDRVDDAVRVVWLSERAEDPEFVIVAIGVPPAEDKSFPVKFAHFGYAVASRAEVDAIAGRGQAAGLLLQGPLDAGPIVGYYCILRDPDGNLVEFSHGQPINPKNVASRHLKVET